MDWVDRMNRAMDYLEAHLTEEIDPKVISLVMASPFSAFQRSFGPITGVSLAEYLRRRRLTQAAYDLRNTDMRVLDVAVKYGYDSADAFAAAFRRMHGLTPQEARKPEANLKFFARITFTLQLTGVTEMNYRTVEREPFGVLGVRRTTPHGGGTWAVVKGDGWMERLQAAGQHPFDLGMCFGFDAQGNNDYMCAIEYEGADVAGFDRYEYPKTTWLVFSAKGAISEGVLGQTWKRIYGEFLPQSQYRQLDLPTIEQYIAWDDGADACHVDIWIPVEG